MVVGTIVVALRVAPSRWLRAIGTVYVETFRNTPLLVVFFVFFFGLPKLGFIYTPFVTTAIVMSLYTGAYLGEAIRSGINSVASGQAEAARAIGLNFIQVLGVIVIPQPLRTVVGAAATTQLLTADDLVPLGSPGAMAEQVDQLGRGRGRVFVGEARYDLVADLGAFGADPGDARFGATRIRADPGAEARRCCTSPSGWPHARSSGSVGAWPPPAVAAQTASPGVMPISRTASAMQNGMLVV